MRLPRYFFSREDLRPYSSSLNRKHVSIICDDSLEKIESFSQGLVKQQSVRLSRKDLAENPDLAVFIAFLSVLGPTLVIEENDELCVKVANQIASGLVSILLLYLKHRYTVLTDWKPRFGSVTDQLTGVEFIHYVELQRIEQSKHEGKFPEAIQEFPVSFAVIKGYSKKRGEAVYLLELNSTWDRYNLIGGRRQPIDGNSYEHTCLREIEEELGIPRDRVSLRPLTKTPLDGYGLSGSRGILGHYPCMLYLASIRGEITTSAKDKWFTLDEILALRNSADRTGLLINPVYLDFLLHKLPGGLVDLEFSLKDAIDSGNWYYRLRDFIVEYEKWIIAALSLLTALISLIIVLLQW